MKTICATCDYLDHEDAKEKNPKMWQCNAPRDRVLDFVSGLEKKNYVLCRNKNTGACRHWMARDEQDLMKVLGIKPKRWWSRLFTRKFWVGVTTNVIFDLLGLGIVYLLVKSHGGIAPW
jgi:hypothetical protein